MSNEPLEREPIDRMRATPLRDVAPALNGRASLAGVRPCRTGAASFMVARARGRRLSQEEARKGVGNVRMNPKADRQGSRR